MVRVYFDPQGMLIFSADQTSTANGRSQLKTNTSNNNEAMNKLKKRIQELEGMLDISDQTEVSMQVCANMSYFISYTLQTDPQNSTVVTCKQQDDA